METESQRESQVHSTEHRAKDQSWSRYRQTLPQEVKASLLLHAGDERWLLGWHLSYCYLFLASSEPVLRNPVCLVL